MSPRFFAALTSAFLVIALQPAAHSQGSPIVWTKLAWPYADIAAACARSDGSILAVRPSDLQVYQSTDHGATWSTFGQSLPDVGSLPLTSIAETRARSILVGSSGFTFASRNGGASWDKHGGFANAFARDGAGNVYALTMSGASRSSDDGRSWKAISVIGSTTCYAGASDSMGNMYLGTAAGLVRSSDYGQSWSLTGLAAGILCDAVATDIDGTVYSSTWWDSQYGGVFRSTNAGASWTQHAGSSPFALFVLPGAGLIVAGQMGIATSTDGGATWIADHTAELQDRGVMQLFMDRGGYLYARTAGALFRTATSLTSVPRVPVPSTLAFTAYPNPFSTSSDIVIDMPVGERTSVVVTDFLGRSVATLHDGWLEAGRHTLSFSANDLPPGAYGVVLRSPSHASFIVITKVR